MTTKHKDTENPTCCNWVSVSPSTLAVASSIKTTFAGDNSALREIISRRCWFQNHGARFGRCFCWWSCWQMFSLLLLNCLKTNLARQSNCLCPADNEDRSSRAPSPPSLFINPSNLPQLSIFFKTLFQLYFAFLTASNNCRSEQNPTGSRFSRNVPVNRKGSCGMMISCSLSSSRSSILMLTVSM